MATQGIVSLVNEQEKTIVKVVAGCNGAEADSLVEQIKAGGLQSADEIYEAAKVCEFGCLDCLVVVDKDKSIMNNLENLHPRYSETFDQPEFNPRWENGTASYVRVIQHRI